MARVSKSRWILLILMLIGLVGGTLLGQAAAGVSWLAWLNVGTDFGLANVNLIILTFSVQFHITIASLIGLFIGFAIYKWL